MVLTTPGSPIPRRPPVQLTESFTALLQGFRAVFTSPSYVPFVALVTGWLLTHRRRFVTELIQASGSTAAGHHSRYHRFFSAAAWSLDALWQALAVLLVGLFAPCGLVVLAVDD